MSSRSKKRTAARVASMTRREEGFNNNMTSVELPKYNGLHDANLRHYFENRRVQGHLHELGLIDSSGRVLDLDKAKAKLAIIDNEFKHAEKSEYWRQKEETEMRRRVQAKRHEALERARFEERMTKVKEDRRIRAEIVGATREAAGMAPAMSRSSGGLLTDGSGFA